MSEPGPAPAPTWRALLEETRRTLETAGSGSADIEAWRLLERAAGLDGPELALALDGRAPARGVAHLDAMTGRRAKGEPLQYVVGCWGFRRLDLLVDARVLIPRPETEQVVEVALQELAGLAPAQPTVVDLGTGSGAIALSVATEVPAARVWGVDISADALAVARANLAGTGRAGARVRLVQGDWFAALPDELAGTIDVVVANPPYVAAGEVLPPEVADWEPGEALVAGPTGLEHAERIVAAAPRWLAGQGSLVMELAPHQREAVAAMAVAAGFSSVEVRPDLTGRPRALVARRR